MSEQDRLLDRLFNDPARRLVNFKIFLGEGRFTSEELCAEINRAMDDVERRRAAGELVDQPPISSGRTPIDVRDVVACLEK